MIIRTAKKQQRYSVVDNTGFEDPRLSYKAKGLLGYFLTKPDDWEIRMDDLARHGRDGDDSIRAGLKELRNCGYAELQYVRGERGKVLGTKWVIHESPTSPRSAKTETRKNRDSEKPRLGKSASIVYTDTLVNTDTVDNTDFTTTARENQNPDVENQKKEKSPRVPAGPPVLFADSEFADRFDRFQISFQFRYPSFNPDAVDLQHYFNRCTRWSRNRGATSPDWLGFAADIIQSDLQKGKLITPKPLHDANSGSNSLNQSGPGQSANPAGFDRDAIAASARRVVEGYSRKNRL